MVNQMQQCLDFLGITNDMFKQSQQVINKMDLETYTEVMKVKLDLIALEIRLKRALKL